MSFQQQQNKNTSSLNQQQQQPFLATGAQEQQPLDVAADNWSSRGGVNTTTGATPGANLRGDNEPLFNVESQSNPSMARNLGSNQAGAQQNWGGAQQQQQNWDANKPSVGNWSAAEQKNWDAKQQQLGKESAWAANIPTKSSQLTGEQSEFKINEAQQLLKQLQSTFLSGELPGSQSLDEILSKGEALLNTAQNREVDPETKKILSDISTMISSMRAGAQQKGLGDKLQSIVSETSQAVNKAGGASVPSVSGSTKSHVANEAMDFVQTWRTLFELLMSSREFRKLLVDSVSVAKRIFLRHSDGLGEQAKQEYLAGKAPTDIAKDVSNQAQQKSQSPVTGEYQVKMTEDESNQLKDDAARILATIGKNPTYRQGVERIFQLIDITREQAKAQANAQTQQPAVARAKPNARKAKSDTKELVAAFSGKEALDNFLNDFNNLISKFNNDNETIQYLKEVRTFILEEPTREREENLRQRMDELIDRGRNIVDKYRYADELDNFLDSANEMLENIKNDEFVSLMKHHAGIVASDLSYTDASGQTVLDTEILGKLRSVIVPVIADTLKYIPIGKIEGSDKNRDFWVDNIVLCGYDVLPDNIRIHIESDSDLSVRDIEVKKSYTKLVVSLKHIRTEFKDLSFFYHKKTFPEMTEQGKFNLRLGGDGANLTMFFNVEQKAGQKQPHLTKGESEFNIAEMDITFDKSTLKHDILSPIFSTLFKAQIKHNVESEVENALQKLIDNIAGRLTDSLVEVNRPLVSRLESVKQTIKGSDVAQTMEKRKEVLE